MSELKKIHMQIEDWYHQESMKLKYQSQVEEHQTSETVRVYHHNLHRKQIKKTSILKLETGEGIIEGHEKCANYLEKLVEDLLLKPVKLDNVAQEETMYTLCFKKIVSYLVHH